MKRVYFQSTAPKDCRAAVMDFNMNRGRAEAAKLSHTCSVDQKHEQQDDAHASGMSEALETNVQQHYSSGPGAPAGSKWSEYVDDSDDAESKTAENTDELDAHNRIGIGRIEQRETKQRASAKPRKQKLPARTQQPGARHMPYSRPDADTRPDMVEKTALSQVLVTITQQPQRPAPSTSTNNTRAPTRPTPVSKNHSMAANTQASGGQASASKWSQFDSDDSGSGSSHSGQE
ncbi:hypothetical protein H4R26_005522 [Coemansia thaxteri]|uniref:MRN complex-interacting protein N-terminal domain-containing protein n=1 Tax=Coemansia thaxteri TaxID=2663907 RepID=A0A9W8ECH4_9FUNG|nr:hypothetical protein H4R26_005522 [Coemansia thaxteri]